VHTNVVVVLYTVNRQSSTQMFFGASYLNDISVDAEKVEDALAVELAWFHAIHHQHAGRIAAT